MRTASTRTVLALLVAAVMLASCGQADQSDSAASIAPATEESSPQTALADDDVGAIAASQNATAQDVAASEDSIAEAAPGVDDAPTRPAAHPDGSGGHKASPPRGLQPAIARAVDDLVQRVAVPRSQIDVVTARHTVWPDHTLGCKLRGSGRLDQPQRGAVVHLRARDRLYRYHTGRDFVPFLCDPATLEAAAEAARIEP